MKEDSLVMNLAQFQSNLFIFTEAEHSRDIMVKRSVAAKADLLASV